MITKLGKAKLEADIQSLEAELRRTVEERAKAAAEGDLRENSAYIFYGERAEVLRSQIAQAKADLKAAVVQSPPAQNTTVSFGHQVSVRFLADNRELTIVLVGKNDSSLRPGWISIDSPLGLALLGHHIGDTVIVNDQPITIKSITVADI